MSFGRLIEHLKTIGVKMGCYKVLLDCSEKNVPFYERTGFKKKCVQPHQHSHSNALTDYDLVITSREVQMVCYLPKQAAL